MTELATQLINLFAAVLLLLSSSSPVIVSEADVDPPGIESGLAEMV